MIKLIVPPIIIIMLLAFLIILLSQAVRRAQEQGLEYPNPEPGKKKKWLSGYTNRAIGGLRNVKEKTEKLAQRRRITAAVEEARTNKAQVIERGRQHGQVNDPTAVQVNETVQRQRMSRMGEIILNYHRQNADGDIESSHNPQEASLIQSVENDPQNAEGYERLGDFYMERQKFEDARECYKYVLRLDPRHRRAQEAMKNLDRVLG